MANPSRYSSQSLQQAAAFDPRILDRLRAMQEYAAEAEPKMNPLFGQLLTEAGGGPTARPPEAIVLQAKQGQMAARQQTAGWDAARNKTIEILTRDFDPAEFERFRNAQRMNSQMLHPQQSFNPFGVLSDVLARPGR